LWSWLAIVSDFGDTSRSHNHSAHHHEDRTV
jgi:hypothetical protein